MTIKKCVFCGSKDVDWVKETLPGDDRETFKVSCGGCGYELAGFDTSKEAVNEWNGMDKTADKRLFGLATRIPAKRPIVNAV